MILLFKNADIFRASAVLTVDLNSATHTNFHLFDPTGGPHFSHSIIGSYKSFADAL